MFRCQYRDWTEHTSYHKATNHLWSNEILQSKAKLYAKFTLIYSNLIGRNNLTQTYVEIPWNLELKTFRMVGKFDLIIFVYLSSLPVAHLSDAPRRRLVVSGDSARIMDETTENSTWFYNMLGV